MEVISCHCGKIASGRCIIYKSGVETFRCFDCADQWLKDTSRCPKCNGSIKECHPEKNLTEKDKKACRYIGSQDRGVTSLSIKLDNDDI